MSVSITLGEIASREVCAIEKEKAGERPSPGGDWLGVTRGSPLGVMAT